MKKIKKGIACLITSALIGTSLPWTAFAQSVRVVKPVGTQASGIAGLSLSTQLQPVSAVTFAPAASGDLKLPAPTVLPGAADPPLAAPVSPAVMALPELTVPHDEAAPAAAEGEAPAAGKTEKASTRGRFDGSVIFDQVRRPTGAMDGADGMDPTPVEFTELRKYAPGHGRGILKAKDKINNRIYYQAPNGTIVPVNGDVAGYLQPARLTLYKSKSKRTGPIYVVAPSGRSSLKNYEADLEALASDALARGARLQRVLDRLGRPTRARGATKEFSEKLKELQRELAEYRTAQEAWTAKKNDLYGRAKEADVAFLKAVVAGADFGKKHADLSFQALVQYRFANADALMAALYPEYIKDLRRYIPNLNSLGVADFDKSVFNDPELTLEFIKYRKAYRNRDVPAIGTLSQAQIAFSPETIPAVLGRLAAFQKPSLKPLVPEARALVLEALAQTEKARQALDKLDAAIRSADSEKNVRGALKEATAALATYTTEREAWKPKRDAFYTKAKDADKLFLAALIDGADFKKLHKKNITLGALLTERFATADDLLSALYPDHIEELRRDIPNLKSLPVADFESSMFVDRELTLEFLENQRSRGKNAHQNIRGLSQVAWAFLPKDIPALLERVAKDKSPLKSVEPGLSELANEALPVLGRWEKMLDRLQAAFAEDRAGKAAAQSMEEMRRMIAESKQDASGWRARRDALLGKVTDGQVRNFLAAVVQAIDPQRTDLNSLLSTRFRNADELLSWLYPKRIEELRLYVPDLKSIGVSDFQSSIFLHPELTYEFIKNRKSLQRKDFAAIGALSSAKFDVSPKSIPAMLSRLEKHEDGVLKPYEAELQGLVNEAMPALAQWDRAVENLKRAVAGKGGSEKASTIIEKLSRMTAVRQDDASGWRARRDAFLGKVSDPVLRSFLTQMLTPLDPNPVTVNTMMAARFHNADELLAWLHPQRIEELRRFMPGLSAMRIDGFERSIFVDRDKVGEFIANRALLGESAPQTQSKGLQDVRYVVPMGRDKLKPKFKSGDFRLPYRVPGVRDLEDFSDPNNPGYATFRPDAMQGAAKEKLKERFGIFSDLVEDNFRVLPIISKFSSEPMPKAAGRAIVAEVGTMVAHYETLTKSAQKAADGQAVRERYAAIVAELEQLWKDVPETGTLPEAVAERISSIEPGAELAAIQNIHTMVNSIHQRSFEALSAQEAAGNESGAINFNNEIPFMDLGDEPLSKNNHLLSKPLRALLNRDKRPGGHQTDTVIIRGDEAWVHAHLGLHSAEIYVKFADPDDGGMLRIRYQEGTNTPIGNPARLALVREEHMRLEIHTEVEDTRPRNEKTGKPITVYGKNPLHLVSIIDKDHGLTSEKQLERLFSFTLQGLHDTLDMNCAFNDLGEDGCAKVVPQLADIYIAEGRWAEGWNRGGNYHDFHKEYMARNKTRDAMRKTLDKELARLGLPTIPEDAVMGQAAVEKHFTAAVHRALIRGELKWDDAGIPQRQNYRPVEALATYVHGRHDAAEAAASVLGHFESELEYEPIGAVGAMRADRAIWQFGDQALVLYGLREPETGTLGYAAAFRHDPAAGLTKLDAEGLVSFLRERGIETPVPEALSGAQKAMLEDWLLRRPLSRSPLSGTRVDGLAASAGQGGLVRASVTFDRRGKPGAALIVPYTTPDDIDAIKNAAAVVTTGGGLLSHAAITTRELGLASVILPRAEWKKTADGKDELELTTYEPEGETVHVAGTVVRPRLRPVRLTLHEGDLVRVNGATGEMYLFPKASESRKAGAVAFAMEEALFNPLKRASAGTILSKLLAHTREDIRQQARDHGRRLFEDRLAKVKSNIPAESEAGSASIAAFHAEIKQLEGMAALFDLKTDALAPLKADEERLRTALAKREKAALIAARPEVVRLNSTKPTTADLPAVRRLVRLLQNRPVADKVYAKSTLGLFQSLERMLRKEKQSSIKNMAPSVLPLGVVDDDYRILVGGKLSKLGEILAVVRKAGGYVPEALAVTTEAYRRFLRENDLEKPLRVLAEQLDAVLSSAQSEEARQEKVAEISKQIHTLLFFGKLDPNSGVGKEIWEGMQARGLAADGKQLAIRSSAVQEDTADAAFAGAAESYLHVKPEEVLYKVIENWTSFWLPRGIVYRHQQKIPSTSLTASTIIQEMAQADVAGVLFTQNPVTGADEFVINAAYGLGEGIVSGIVQTDRYVARKSDGQETKLPFIGDKRVAVMPKSGASGTELQGVPAERRKRRALTPQQTQRLALIAKALEAHFGYPLDIEFAVKGDRIAILQARPVTTRGQAEAVQAEEKGPLVIEVPRPEAPSQKPAVAAAPAKKKIVFVCTGNACRSPMAEFFAKDMLVKEGDATVEVFSRGVHARDGGYMSPDSLYQLELDRIDGRSHRSHKLKVEDVRNADYILAMDQSNVDDILRKFPEAGGKTHLLKEFARTGTGDVENPWPAIGRAYEETAAEIVAAVDEVARSIQSGGRKLKSIVFACAFNTSRSPMAEYFAKEELKRLGINNVKVISRSLYAKAHIGKPLNWKAQELLESLEIDGSKHKSTPLTQQEAKDADAILVMDYDNLGDIAKRFPEARDKTFLLKQFAKTGTGEIENPSKKIFRAYDKAGKEIKEAVKAAIEKTTVQAEPEQDPAHRKKRVTFVCMGNACRSPMAEYFARDMLAKGGKTDVEVFSRAAKGGSYYSFGETSNYPFGGSSRDSYGGMSQGSMEFLKASGIDGGAHRSKGLTLQDVMRSDVLLVMDEQNLDDILRQFPEAEGKTFLLKEFAGTGTGDIDTPAFGNASSRYMAYQQTAKEITAAVKVVAKVAASAERKLKSIMFACTWNTSRSPMAEYYAKDELQKLGVKDVRVFSRSVGYGGGRYVGFGSSSESYSPHSSPMKGEALDNLAATGLDGREHKSTPMSAEDVAGSDVILVMEKEHVDNIIKRFPEAKGKVFLLNEFAGLGASEIENPSKTAPRFTYMKAGTEIKEAVRAAIDKSFTPPEPQTEAAPKKSVLFVCAANCSRSPLAERLFRERLRREGIADVDVWSRGLGAFSGGSMADLSKDVLRHKGIPVEPHSGRGLTIRDIRRATVILVMEPSQKREVESRYPSAKGKVFTMKEYAGGEGPILDHVRTIEAFLDIADQMEATFDALVENLKK